MGPIEEVKALEKKMIAAELGPDPKYFEEVLADDAILDGQKMKAKVVAAHRPDSVAPKFTRVEMSDYEYVDHGNAVVVLCKGTYESAKWSGSLRFMRVWAKNSGRWQIIAGTTANA